MKHSRSELTVEASAWISALEALTAQKGLRLDERRADIPVGELCEGLGCGLVFYGRARAKGHPAADEFLGHLLPMVALLGLSLDEIRNLRPLGVA